jgi:CheY-like chemotaxis protein
MAARGAYRIPCLNADVGRNLYFCSIVFKFNIMDLQSEGIRSILIIDDDRDDFELVSEAVKKINANISVAYLGGCDEIDQYRERHFDLVLLDINMPHHDGFFWLNAIRKQGYKNLPVVMFTNSAYPGHIAKAYDEGANLYFQKPESFDFLIKGMKKLIQLDWANPFRILESHRAEGSYRTFQVE